MRERLNFWVIGGDPRQAALAKALNEDGHTVHTFALEHGMESSLCADSLAGAAIADCVILPLPAVNGGLISAPLSDRRLSLADTLAALRPGQLLCAGRASPLLQEEAAKHDLRLVDYFAREELAIANAVPVSLAV